MLRRLILPLLLVLVTSLHAQSVRWEPGSGTLALNQLSELSLVFDQCEPKSVTLPAVPGLTFTQPPSRSQQTSYNVVNFQTSSSKTVTLTYRVRPTQNGPLTIPAFQIDTDRGMQTVSSATFDTGTATVGQSSLPLESIVQSKFTPPEKPVWAGEVFPLAYSLNVARRYFYQLGSDLDWNPAPLSIETWSKPELIEAAVNGDPRVSIVYKTRAYAKSAGSVPLAPATQLVNLSTGSSSFTIFARPSLEQFSITSQPATLTVKPLPSPAPAGFTGAVGKFTLDSKVVPATATVGEPITWTLTLDGTGNWPDIGGLPARSVSKDFRVVQPQAKRTNKPDALFDAALTEDVVLIPSKPGNYTLGPVNLTVFNPATGAYETLTTPPVTIQIAAAASASAPTAATPTNGSTPQPDSTPAAPRPPAATPPAPAALPRDPLPPAAPASTPLSPVTVLIGLLTSVLVPLSVWSVLARRRALATDPGRPLREAHARLAATLRQLAADSQPSAPNPQLLQSWQRDAAILFRLPQAVPTPASFANETWAALWADADRTLYGSAPLPADWLDRATQALAAHRPPAFSSFQLFLPRNLLPLVLVLATLAIAPASFAADGRDAYAKADFPAAEAAWRDALKAEPADWTAHHNLALALLQQNRAAEAAGHTLAAFVQQPQNPSVRSNLAYAWNTAAVTPVALKPFLTDAPAASLARLASPARWQAALIVSAWLGAAALALGLYGAYQQRPRRWLAGGLLIVSVLLAAAAGVSLQTYGSLKDARAVVVVTATTLRSIPTDLDTPQKSTPLAVGVIGTTDKSFLGWRRVVFTEGQTGWVRAETLVPLWR